MRRSRSTVGTFAGPFIADLTPAAAADPAPATIWAFKSAGENGGRFLGCGSTWESLEFLASLLNCPPLPEVKSRGVVYEVVA